MSYFVRPPYPGNPMVNSLPIMQYGPSFDGQYAHGLTTNPYLNSVFEEVNGLQNGIFTQAGTGYPPVNTGYMGF